MGDKAAVGANVYIEDSPENVRKLRKKNFDVIVFANSTNRRIKDQRVSSWREVEKLVMRKFSEWKLDRVRKRRSRRR